MNREFKADFVFKDERQYVNSSSQVEELTSLIHSKIWAGKNWKNPKLDARFHKEIKKNGVFRLSENKALLVESESASSNFTFYDSKSCIYAVLTETESDNILRRVRTNYKVDEIKLNDKFCGSCTIGCQTQKAFIENSIEANKRIHLKTLNNDCKKIKVVNMYIRRFPALFPVDGVKTLKEVGLQIQNISYRNQNDSILTLNSLSFPEEKIDSFELAFIVHFL